MKTGRRHQCTIRAAAAVLIVAGGGAVAAAQRGALPDECRREVAALCRGAAGGIRQCVRAALPRLSPHCVQALGAARAEAVPGAREHAYGQDPKQRLDLMIPEQPGPARPLLLFIHGGGWAIGDKRHSAASKARHFNSRGWAFGSVNYRLVPAARVEQQAADVAAAVAYVRRRSGELGIDPGRIVLMGHSAGAHLAALVGTDPGYLRAAGVPLDAIDAIVLLDGAGYDVPRQMANGGNRASAMYQAAFGSDPKRQELLSPTRHAGAPNVASWLILPVSRRPDSMAQSNALAAALNAAGAKALVSPQKGKTHMTLNRELGSEGDPSTAEVDRFLAALR